MEDHLADGERGNSLGIAESRAHSRMQMAGLAYIELSDDNGGLILNIGEDGFAVQAVQVVSPEHLTLMRFRLPKTKVSIEAAGKLVWQLRSRKEAGVQFVDLSDVARMQIRDWIAAETARLAGPTPLMKDERLKKDEKQGPPTLPPPTRPLSGKSLSKRVEPPLPQMEPPLAAAKIPTPPPSEPVSVGSRFAASVPSPQGTVLPLRESEIASSELPGIMLSSAGSVPPAGRVPLRNVERESVPAHSTLPGRMPNISGWNGYVTPGLGVQYRKPRHWWMYIAALGVIVAVGFAGLLMVDPDIISRARLAIGANDGSATVDLSQATTPPAGNGDGAAVNGASPPSNGADDNATNRATQQQTPQQQPRHYQTPQVSDGLSAGSQNAPSGATSLAAGRRAAVNPAPAVKPKNNTSYAQNAEDGRHARQSDNTTATGSHSNGAGSATQSAGASQLSQSSANHNSLAPTQTTVAASNVPTGVEPQPSSPTAAAPVSRPPPSTAQQSATQQPATPTSSGASSVATGSGEASPVRPSVPLIGVPSGSVGATSQFHAIRIPPELQSKAAQMAGNLQIGQLLSSYSPAYPIDAAKDGVEGIVKLDVIVAPNGNVDSAKVLSGPAMLTDASLSAVKQWHYGETLLGGQPIGAEQYVTIVFRLAK